MTGLHVFKAGLFKSIADTNVFRVRILGAWKDVVFMRVYKVINQQGAWHDVWVRAAATPTPAPAPSPTPVPAPTVTLSVTANPNSVSGTRVGQGIVYTNGVTVTATKGTPPYTYKFSRMTYSGTTAPAILIPDGTKPNIAQFSRNMTGSVPEYETARFRCRVTDSLGNTGVVTIDATFLTTGQSGTGGDGTVNGGGGTLGGTSSSGPVGGQIP